MIIQLIKINIDLEASLSQIRENCMTFLDGNKENIEEMDNKIRIILSKIDDVYLCTARDLGLIDAD